MCYCFLLGAWCLFRAGKQGFLQVHTAWMSSSSVGKAELELLLSWLPENCQDTWRCLELLCVSLSLLIDTSCEHGTGPRLNSSWCLAMDLQFNPGKILNLEAGIIMSWKANAMLDYVCVPGSKLLKNRNTGQRERNMREYMTWWVLGNISFCASWCIAPYKAAF